VQAAKATSGSGPRHVLNLGHGVIVGTPEENVKHFFDAARNAKY
jgi:uroporphyrinogen decarboxylase